MTDPMVVIDYDRYRQFDRRHEPLKEAKQNFYVVDLDLKAMGEEYAFRISTQDYMDVCLERGDFDDPKYVIYKSVSNYN